MTTLHPFPTEDGAATALADALHGALDTCLTRQDRAVIAVSGGRSPIPVFRALAARTLPWHRVTVTLVDERCVPSDHPDSNARLVRTHLLTGPALSAAFRPLWLQAASPDALLENAIHHWQTPDITVLGMGEDGHTASLFPDAAALPVGLDPATTAPLILVDPPSAPHRRLSMTATEIARSGAVFLFIAGAKKQSVLTTALAAPSAALPIGVVLARCPAARVFLGPA